MPPTRGISCLSLVLCGIRIGGFHARKGSNMGITAIFRPSMKILIIFIWISSRFGCTLHPLAEMETPRVGETNQSKIFFKIFWNIFPIFWDISCLQVHMIWPVLYILATVFITVVPMIAKPFETGKFKIFK